MSGLLDRLQQCNYILEMLVACLLFALPLKKRHHPWLRFGVGALAALVVSMTVGGISATGVAEVGHGLSGPADRGGFAHLAEL